jgi:hypothetical protein
MTKNTRQKQFEVITGDIEGTLKKLRELANVAGAPPPYLVDAQSFLTQAGVCVTKQMTTEFGEVEAKPPVQ